MGTNAARVPATGRATPLFVAISLTAACIGGCSRPESEVEIDAPVAATRPVYDTTLPRPVAPRDRLEREAMNREGGLQLVDKIMNDRTQPPPFDRKALPPYPADSQISEKVPLPDDTNPFPDRLPLPEKEVTIDVGIGRSTFRTREREEVLSVVQPFIDLTQLEVNIRGNAHLHETAEEIFYALLDGKEQLQVAHVFDYLRVRDWLAGEEKNGGVLLATALPAHPRSIDLDHGLPGTPGTCIELVVAADSKYATLADLKNARLALAANYVYGPGTFLTRLLADAGHPAELPYFSKVTLRRYSKDAVIDLLKGRADVACVDQSTMGTLARFYGIGRRLRTIAISPRYNMDVLFTSQNNVETHQTEIELTQRQLTTLPKDPEGQEVLFFFDTATWRNYADDDIAVPRANYEDYLKFRNQTPVDLKPLLDPAASVDRQTYDRFGDD